MDGFYSKLELAVKEGILLLVKYGFLLAAIVWAFNFSMNTRNMAITGQQTAALISELQKKGWLPAFQQAPNGSIIIPDKPKEEPKVVEENKK